MTWIGLGLTFFFGALTVLVGSICLLATLALALGFAAGWAKTLISLSQSLHPMANAFKVISGVDDLFDKRISSLIERSRQIEARNKAHTPAAFTDEEKNRRRKTVSEQIDDMMGGPTIIAEQPDAIPDDDMEVVN